MLLLARAVSGAGTPPAGAGALAFLALFTHDLLVALAFWAVDRLTLRARALWLAYGLIVVLTAINVPVVRALGTSLTVPMLRAARGPILDSIRVYVTPSNILAILAVVTAALVLPSLLRHSSTRVRRFSLITGVALLVAAAFANAGGSTVGRERNVVTSLAAAFWSRVGTSGETGPVDWRVSPFAARTPEPATDYRGAGKGLNILLIILESTAAQYLKPYGSADDPMPAVSGLASRSLVVDGTYAPYPESIRALYSIGCAQPPAFDVTAEALARTPCESLPERLSQAGYRTALYHSGRFAYLGMTETMALLRFETGVDAGGIGGRVESSFGVDEPSTVTKMLEWIDREATRPFFLTYLPTAGHHPYESSGNGPFAQTDDLSAFKNAIHEGDAAIALLLDGLQKRGLDNRTMVVITSDHGEAFGQHPGNFAHSFFIYDENIRVPLIFHVPGREARRIARVSSLIDVAPTIFDIIGAPPLSGVEGESVLHGPEHMSLFFTDYALGWLGLRDGCMKFMLEVDAKRAQLFNVCEDPSERADIAAHEPDRVAAYRDRVERWAAARRRSIAQ